VTTVPVLNLETWSRAANHDERQLVAAVRGPVLDVGCGPGRMVAALRAIGTEAHGIDAAPAAAAHARALGVEIVTQSIFDPLPQEGRWRTVLLLDGNVGIGGDPVALLTRVRELLHRRGVVLVEVESPARPSEAGAVELEVATRMVGVFPWFWLSVRDIDDVARAARFRVDRVLQLDRRWFAWLRPTF
jgi:SAM-dependent methyltransferase